MSRPDKSIEQQFHVFMEAFQPKLWEAFSTGYMAGQAVGRQQGFFEGVAACTPALSDGLRHGSPECGRVMQALNKLAPPEEDMNED